MTRIPTAFTAVYRTTALSWANRSIPAALLMRSGKTCTMAMASGCFRIPRIPIISMPNIKRSEEHTSELQSLRHLVCRLLLEKKKYKTYQTVTSYPSRRSYERMTSYYDFYSQEIRILK